MRLLPFDIRAKASVSTGGEHAWRKEDFVDVIQAARTAGLALVGGQAQFQFHDGICEPYWLDYKTSGRQPDEPWSLYVERSAREILDQFHALCATTDFYQEAMQWRFIQNKVTSEGINPIDHLWFVVYFVAEGNAIR